MRLFACFCLVILIQTSFAQNDYVSEQQEPVYSGKNEIRTNLTPIAVTFMAGEPLLPRWSLMYRRYISPNKTLRFWINYEQFSFLDEDLTQADKLPTGPDTFNFLVENQNEYGLDARIGMDWSKPDQKISAVYGVDAFVGWESRYYQEASYPYYLDQEMCSNCWVPSPFESPDFNKAELAYLKFGLDFSIGCLFRPTKNWEITLQWTPEIANRTELKSESNSAKAFDEIRNDGLSFHFRGLELFLGFHF